MATLPQFRTEFPELSAVSDVDVQRELTRWASVYSAADWGVLHDAVVLNASALALAPGAGVDPSPYAEALADLAQQRANVPPAPPGGVPTTRIIATTSPLTGGGDLAINRTHALLMDGAAGTAASVGFVQAAAAGAGFIYEPGGVQAGRVYTAFADLIAAVATQPAGGGPVPIVFSDRIVGSGNDVVIPAGTYDSASRMMAWLGGHVGADTRVRLDDGVSFTRTSDGLIPLKWILEDLEVQCFGDSAGSNVVPFTSQVTLADKGMILADHGGGIPMAMGDLPAIDVLGGGTDTSFVLLFAGRLRRGNTQSVRVAAGLTPFLAILNGFAELAGDAFTGPGASLEIYVGTEAATIDVAQPALGSVSTFILNAAVWVAFDDSSGPGGSPSLGVTVQDALDTIKGIFLNHRYPLKFSGTLTSQAIETVTRYLTDGLLGHIAPVGYPTLGRRAKRLAANVITNTITPPATGVITLAVDGLDTALTIPVVGGVTGLVALDGDVPVLVGNTLDVKLSSVAGGAGGIFTASVVVEFADG